MSVNRHLVGLLLGAEEDWPAVFEHLGDLEPSRCFPLRRC